jgi:hypothetical protein
MTRRIDTSAFDRPALAGVACLAAFAGLSWAGAGAGTASADTPATAGSSDHLDLGPSDLSESRSTSNLRPGVTLTRITRGGADRSLSWTAEVLIPSTSTSPDPDAPPRSLSDKDSAERLADRLVEEGFAARVERVDQPTVADVPAGVLGYRVRVGLPQQGRCRPREGSAGRGRGDSQQRLHRLGR